MPAAIRQPMGALEAVCRSRRPRSASGDPLPALALPLASAVLI